MQQPDTDRLALADDVERKLHALCCRPRLLTYDERRALAELTERIRVALGG